MSKRKASVSGTTLALREADRLPDNAQWENRFEIKSSSSNRLYVVAQNSAKRYWACSCPGWKIHRKCKHLAALSLPAYEKPYEAVLE